MVNDVDSYLSVSHQVIFSLVHSANWNFYKIKFLNENAYYDGIKW